LEIAADDLIRILFNARGAYPKRQESEGGLQSELRQRVLSIAQVLGNQNLAFNGARESDADFDGL
jgi:hypothetical protein